MKVDFAPLLKSIDAYIDKADKDLTDALTGEGYPGASGAVKAASKLEDAVDDVLDADSLAFLQSVEKSTGVDDFIKTVWPGIKSSDDLEVALYDIFHKQFDDMLKSFTYEWTLAEIPALAVKNPEVTKPAEDFIKGWSGQLAKLMNLSTKDTMENLLLKAQKNDWSIERLSQAIGDSGIRNYGYRSRRVALTEMLRVESYAQQESMEQNPLAYKKRWVHVDCEQPRENHVAMSGQEVFKRECFTMPGKSGTYYPLCPRDVSLPAEESVNCHCIMETIANENAFGMTDGELANLRQQYMDEVNEEYTEWETRFKRENGIEEPRDDPSVTWEIYNAYYEEYRRNAR